MKVQFPTGTEMAQRFPNGFNDMMNAVYDYAAERQDGVRRARSTRARS